MPNIEVLEQWDDIYQLETTDPVQGGADGVDNLPHKNLANRTLWLKNNKAEKAGDASQKFKVADGTANDDAVNKKQLDAKAELTGSATQKFKVADGTADDDAVNKKQITDLFSTFQPFPIGFTMLEDVIYDFTLVEFGGEFSRTLYPKLWSYIESHPELLKTEVEWQAENIANGMCGFFSSGNGTTTFRVRNKDGAFERASSRGIGIYEGDAIRNISGSMRAEASLASGVFSSQFNTLGQYWWNGTNNSPFNTITFDASTQVPTATENRPKNFAKLPLIVYK